MAKRYPGFVDGILSTNKQKKRFFYFRNLSAVILAVVAYVELDNRVGGFFAVGLAFLALFVAYKTVSVLIALSICFIEQMFE
jgi:hypothetical protein